MDFSVVVDWNNPSNLQNTFASLNPATNVNPNFHIDRQVSLEQQPTPPFSPGDSHTLVCNARIDNRKELINQLSETLSSPDTASDAEIIHSAYCKWGVNCPKQLIGDFAFVLWDKQNATIFAARDGMNMNTLCYFRTQSGLCLASDEEILVEGPQYQPKVSKFALLGWIYGQPDPRVSMFEGIEILPAGHALVARESSINVSKFWDIDPDHKIRYRHVLDYQEHIKELLSRAVSDRLRTQGSTVASQMSGGMDSTTVTALANNLSDKQLLVISHSYRSTPSCDETERIRETIAHLDINNSRFLAAEEHSALEFKQLYPPDLSNPGTVLSPRYIDEMALLREAGASVLLTGSGGDEIAWGHSLSYSGRLKRGDLRVIPEVINGCRAMQLPLFGTLRQLFLNPMIPNWVRCAMKRPIGGSSIPEWAPSSTSRSDLLKGRTNNEGPKFNNQALQARYDAFQWSSTINSVRSYGKVGSRYGIDVRHPFFDTRLAEFSFAIPDDLWNREGYPKWLLRHTMDGTLPQSVCWNRKKVIFDNFFADIIRKQASNIRPILADERLQDMGLLDTNKLLSAFDKMIAGERAFNVDFLYVLMLQVWFQKYAGLFKG